MKFFIKIKGSNSGHEIVLGRKEDTLADALTQKRPQMKVSNMLFWAEIRGHIGMKCVNAFLLPCGFIQPEKDVEMEEMNETIYNYDLNETIYNYSKLRSSIFFISVCGRRKLQAITKVNFSRFGRHDICVVAIPGKSFREALMQDGRFINVDQFTLKQKVVGGEGAEININEKPADLGEEIVLEVKVSRTMNKSKYNDVDTAKKPVSETPRKKAKKSYDELTGKLWEENTVYVFSKAVGDLTNQEILSEREECLRARAWCTLVGPKDRGMTKFEKSLDKLAKDQFANHNVISRPVRFTKPLSKLYDSIGYLQCGSVTATCFLVSNNMIATNCHVVKDIEIARKSSIPGDHSEVYVHFDYESNEARPSNRNGHKLQPFSYKFNAICQPLDYAFLFLEERVGRRGLGDRVRCNVPEEGMVCIVGHPGGEEKQDELCPILPLHGNRRSLELERRYAEHESHCAKNQFGCALPYAGQKCVHSYQSKLQQLCSENAALTYDVGSLFRGSSGAPVFDMKCNIVALHTGGFFVGKTSIVEYGVTFEAIIENLRSTGRSNLVKKHFPYCQ